MWAEKVVCVAGGSRGFGLQIAKAFHRQGSKVVLLARNEDRVHSVVQSLNGLRADSAAGVPVDLSDDQQRAETIAKLPQQHGQVDVWINAVGQSIRTGFNDAKLTDYRRLMEKNFFVSVGCSLDVLPELQKSAGYLVNIGSLASKTSWHFLAPYVASKHALAGFAKQLRLEGPQEVHYLFVCPGPIRSDEAEDRYSDQAGLLPQSANAPGAGAPIKALDPEWLAKRVVACCQSRQSELVVPWKSKLLFTISSMFPGLGDRLVRRLGK